MKIAKRLLKNLKVILGKRNFELIMKNFQQNFWPTWEKSYKDSEIILRKFYKTLQVF